MKLEWVGQFSFSPGAFATPLQPSVPFIRSTNDVLRERGPRLRGAVTCIRVTSRNRFVLFDGCVRSDQLQRCLSIEWPSAKIEFISPPAPILRGPPQSIEIMARSMASTFPTWRGSLYQNQVNWLIQCLRSNYQFVGPGQTQIVSGVLGQDESIPGITIECSKCKLWEKQTGVVASAEGCKCEPDPLKIGGAAVVVGALVWYLMK